MAKKQAKTNTTGTKILVELGALYKELKEVSDQTGVNMTRIIRDCVAAKLKAK